MPPKPIMKMSDNIEILKTLDNTKLVDVVKNYKQHGYDESTRVKAITILEERGVSVDDLKLTGNFENNTFNEADRHYNSFFKNSKITLLFYCVLILSNILSMSIAEASTLIATVIIIASWTSVVLYLLFLVKSFLDHDKLYKIIGNNYTTSSITMYYFFGAPVYFIIYFVLKKQIYNEMKTIR